MKERAPLVSVLMATYNYGRFLPEAIESVLAQRMGDFELIVGDNASTDHTPEILRAYAERDPRVKPFCNRVNVGITANFNRCYQRASPNSKYFLLLPADDKLTPDALEALVEVAERHPEVAVVHADAYRTTPNGRVLNTYTQMVHSPIAPGRHRAARELYRTNYIPAQAALVSRAWFERLYPEPLPLADDLVYASDYHLWLQIFTRGGWGYYLPRQLAFIRKHERAHTIEANIVPRLLEERYIFEHKLAGVCPPALEEERVRAVAVRTASLGFVHLRRGQVEKAGFWLSQALRYTTRPRRDLTVARWIAGLPAPRWVRAQLWRLAEVGGRLLFRRASA